MRRGAVSGANAPFPVNLADAPQRSPPREPWHSRDFELKGSATWLKLSRPRDHAQQRPRPAGPDGDREGGCLERITLPAARPHTQRFGAGQGRRYRHFQHGTSALRESIESPEALLTDDRTSIVVQNHDLASANQKAPLASDALVKPRRPTKQIAVTPRSDHEVVPEPGRLLGFLALAPELHETASSANSIP